jgi:NADH:quinone reductase (non-electrogenic)
MADRADRHRVVVVGSGFGGLFAARRLKGAQVDVTVIDRTTHHLFQPLLYQVATGILSEGEIAPPMRDVLRRQRNARVVLGEVVDIDLEARSVTSSALDHELVTTYDSLIVAAGCSQSYFGHDEFSVHAPGLKTIDDALEVRSRIFGAFELAEIEPDWERRAAWLTFVVVGAGPAGVEMAGQIAELARLSLRANFRNIDPAQARVLLLDGAPRILGAFHERLSGKAAGELRRLGVEIHVETMVTGLDADGVDVQGAGGEQRRLQAMTKIWAAGVQASSLGAMLAERSNAELTRAGQVKVEADCTLPGHREVFVVGDMMALDDLPGLAEVAMQSGRHAASEIHRRLGGETKPRPFRYLNLGSLAAISRYYAIGERGRVRLWGLPGWLVWLVVHLTFLTGFKNRAAALFHWIVSFFWPLSRRADHHHPASAGQARIGRCALPDRG